MSLPIETILFPLSLTHTPSTPPFHAIPCFVSNNCFCLNAFTTIELASCDFLPFHERSKRRVVTSSELAKNRGTPAHRARSAVLAQDDVGFVLST